jgi:ABC-type polysaccharide/polyol phosphate export permease
MVQPYRDVLLNQSVPDWRGMLYMLVLAAVLYVTGLSYFRRLKGYFEMAL